MFLTVMVQMNHGSLWGEALYYGLVMGNKLGLPWLNKIILNLRPKHRRLMIQVLQLTVEMTSRWYQRFGLCWLHEELIDGRKRGSPHQHIPVCTVEANV
jgi:hypothetical protein